MATQNYGGEVQPSLLSRRAKEPQHWSGTEFQESPRVATPYPCAKVAYKPPLPIV